MILKKLLESIFQFFQYKVRKTTLCLLFTFMFTFSFKFLQTSLIIKELIKHENKFNRKVFHDRENSENRFSEFSYFMKCFNEYASWTFIGILHNEKLSQSFMKCSERNISQCILAFGKFLKGNAQLIFKLYSWYILGL